MPGKYNRHTLKSRITSILIGFLIFVFAGVLQQTYQSGSLLNYGPSDDQAQSQYTEKIDIAAIYSGTISKNSSLYNELMNSPVSREIIAGITSRLSSLFDLRRSKPGDSFKLFVGAGDTVLAFEYMTKDWRRYRLDREGDGYIASVHDIDLERKVQRAEGIIESSLWDALLPVLPDMEIFADLTDIFGWEIDFLTESQFGDRFSLIFETFEKDSIFVKPGRILAAEYVLGGVAHRAFFFMDSTGHKDYYDEKGYCLRKSFLKSPLNYRRISSRFSRSRLHPIYKIYRPHLGVDYAAAEGTPVVAAGEGHIVYKGWKNGFGNYLEIKHPSSMVTCYGHLRGFARGISNGSHVTQGQVIGYVGSTGQSTGPHLDYRVMKNGSFIDPLKMVVPASLPVKDNFRPDFQLLVDSYLPILQNPTPDTVLALLN
jgi:murein DD-endopeptidase MepM/ murein hydrolase activator NlpD